MLTNRLFYLVDDDQIFRFVTGRMIEMMVPDAKVVLFHSAEEVLDLLRKNREDSGALPDVLLLDLHMPCVNGWDFLREFCSLKPLLTKSIHIHLFATGTDEKILRQTPLLSEVCSFGDKPLSKDEIEALSAIPR